MSLAGVPPLAGWFAKFAMFQATIGVGSGWGYSIAIIAAINAVIAFLIVAWILFMIIRSMNQAKAAMEKKAEEEAPAAPAGPTQEELLGEIRDLLAKNG